MTAYAKLIAELMGDDSPQPKATIAPVVTDEADDYMTSLHVAPDVDVSGQFILYDMTILDHTDSLDSCKLSKGTYTECLEAARGAYGDTVHWTDIGQGNHNGVGFHDGTLLFQMRRHYPTSYDA